MEQARFARLIVMKTKKGKSQSFVDTFRKDVASSAGEIPGLRRLYLLSPADRKREFVALSLWDDEKSAKEYVKSGKDDVYSAKLEKVLSSMKVRKCGVESHVVGKGAKGES